VNGDVLHGLARNPAAPDDILLALIADHPRHAATGLEKRKTLSSPVQSKMFFHDSRAVRRALARHRSIEFEHRARFLTDDEWLMRLHAFGPRDHGPVADWVLVRLLTDLTDPPPGVAVTHAELVSEFWDWKAQEPDIQRAMLTHPLTRVRLLAAESWMIDRSHYETLLADEAPEVRAAAAAALEFSRRERQPADLIEAEDRSKYWVLSFPLSRALIDHVIAEVGLNRTTPPEVVEKLMTHPAPEVRVGVALRATLTGDQVARLTRDPDPEVRTALSIHRGLSEVERAAIDIDVSSSPDHGHLHRDRFWCAVKRAIPGPPKDVADAIAWAGSVNPLLRRRAARHDDLPADLVACLADDEDEGVRVLLAAHHADVPPALVLRCLLEYEGCGRELLLDHPNLPRSGVGGYATSDDPLLRRLATRDPDAPPEAVERLLQDVDEPVRKAAAESPALPAARIEALLSDAELAEPAAANPSLPLPAMHRLVRR
jgi:hypothetical protein